MNLDAIVDRAEARFQDSANGVYTVSEWEDFVNDAYVELQAARPDWPWMKTEVTISWAALDGEVALTDFGRIDGVFNATDHISLVPIHGNTTARETYPTWPSDPGTPVEYRLEGQALQLYPAPQTAISVIVRGWASVGELSSGTDEPAFLSEFHRILVYGALVHAFEDDGNLKQAEVYQRKYDRLLMAMVTTYSARVDKYAEVVDTF